MADMNTKTVYSQMAFLYHVTCLHQVTVTPYISKYGCYVYWTGTKTSYGHMALLTSRDICLSYVGVIDLSA